MDISRCYNIFSIWPHGTCNLGSCHQGQDALFFCPDFSKGQVLLPRNHGVKVEGTDY